MPLYEVETDAHIMITWADADAAATAKVKEAYPEENIVRLTRRPRDSWVISKSSKQTRQRCASISWTNKWSRPARHFSL